MIKGILRKIRGRKEDRGITLREYLEGRIVGQRGAIEEVIKRIKVRAKRGGNILGVFLFVGATGVGKTETAKAIGEWFKDRYGHQFLRFDMGGFSDYHTASTLLGSPRGYVGSEEGGALTRPLMENPRAVILFDEMEKAHSSLYRPLMSLIDEGRVQEIASGKDAYIKQGVIVFTSNLYQRTIRQIEKVVEDEVEREVLIRDLLTGKEREVEEVVGREVIEEDRRNGTVSFPPEFIGRIDSIVVFNPLTVEELAQIVYRMAGDKLSADKVWEIVRKHYLIANKYGVRMFIKKVEEDVI